MTATAVAHVMTGSAAPDDTAGRFLARTGIHHRAHRAVAVAVAVGERPAVLEDRPTSPNRMSPYAPVRIAEMVRQQEGHTS